MNVTHSNEEEVQSILDSSRKRIIFNDESIKPVSLAEALWYFHCKDYTVDNSTRFIGVRNIPYKKLQCRRGKYRSHIDTYLFLKTYFNDITMKDVIDLSDKLVGNNNVFLDRWFCSVVRRTVHGQFRKAQSRYVHHRCTKEELEAYFNELNINKEIKWESLEN